MRKLATAAAVSLALASGGAFGLGLGDIDMRSALNQPMNAQIPLTAVKAGELDGMIVKLADDDAFARAGIERTSALTDLEFAVDNSSGRPVIRVTSGSAVTEPFLNFLLEVDWRQGRMVREYTVLLDPPVFMTQGPSVRDDSGDQAVIAGGDTSIVAPAPILRTTPEEGFDVELVGGSGEVDDDSLLGGALTGGEVVSLDDLINGPAVSPPSDGEVVSLTDLEAPNTAAVAERAARAASRASPRASADFDVELVGDDTEVDNDSSPSDATTSARAGGVSGEVVSLEALLGARNAKGEVTVSRGDTLFEIARQNKPDGVSTQQMMLALLEANRSAFINENINLVKAGTILRVPRTAEARALSQAEALAEIGRQNDLWREYRDNLRGTTAATQLASGSVGGAGGPGIEADVDAEDAGNGLSTDAQAILDAAREEVRQRESLSIVADDTTAQNTASATADETEGSDSARLGEINRQLQLAREELAATRVEGDDLGEQAVELQSTGDNLDALVSLRQNEIAKLEAQLVDARAAEETAAEGGGGEAAGDAADAARGLAADAGDAVGDAAADAGDVMADAGDAVAGAGDAAVEGGQATIDGASEAGGAAVDAATAAGEDVQNALSGNGQDMGSVELVGDDSDADGSTTAGGDAGDAATDGAAGAGAGQELPWYRTLLEDPTKLAIIGAGGLGVLGLIGTLLWRRRRKDDDDPLAGFHDGDAEFVDDHDAVGLQAEVASQSSVDEAAFAAEGDTGSHGIGGVGKGAVAGVAGLGAASAAAFGGRDEDEMLDHDADGADHFDDGDLDKDDTITEVDVYLAYGLHGQAEELLTKAIERKPGNMAYAEKLLQTYHAQGNGEGFQRTAADYHARFGGDGNPAWGGIADMGRELRPGEALFGGAAGGVMALGAGQLDDSDFAAGGGGGSPGSVNRDFGASDSIHGFGATGARSHDSATGAFDDTQDESLLMDQSLDPAFAFDEGDLEATGDFSQIADELAAEGDSSMSVDDFDATSGGLTATSDRTLDMSSDRMPLAELPDGHSLDDALTLDELDLDSTAAIAANDMRADGSPSFDLDATSVDGNDFADNLGSGMAGAASGTFDDTTGDFGELEMSDLTADNELLNGTGATLGEADEMDTMMDLAKAYIDMGDKDSASNALGEIVKSGNPEQISEAETLLRKIS